MGTKLIVGGVLLAVFVAYSLIDKFDPDSVKGKRVLVTGASTGIGEQLAYHYARLGARLVITARREAVLQKVVEKCKEIGGPGGEYSFIAADMSKFDDVKRVAEVAIKRLGGLDTLVLNHIGKSYMGHWEGTQANFTNIKSIFEVNFNSYVYLASYAKEHLEESKGNLIVVSSIAGKVSSPQISAYSASKFALDGFFGVLRQEFLLRQKDVSVTLCVIGLIGTENAISNLKELGVSQAYFDLVQPASPSDTALAIIKGGALRKREMYYPYLPALIVTMLRDICPYPQEYLSRYLYQV